MGDGGGELGPGVLSIGGGIVTTLIGVSGKLWAQLLAERRDRATEVEGLRHELAEANARVVELQDQATRRSDEHQREHRRDLRRLAGLSTSMDPPPLPGGWPPVVIREAPARPLPPAKKPR